MNANPLCMQKKNNQPTLFGLLSFSNTNMEMGLDSGQDCIMLHAIWLPCCALGLLAISTSKTENLASAMSCCVFLADMHCESKSKSLGCFIIHYHIQQMLLAKQTDGSLPSGNSAKLFLHRKFSLRCWFSRELHKTHSNSALSSRWFMFQTAHERLSQTSQLLAGKRSRRFGKETWVCGYGRWRRESGAPGGDGKARRFGITTEAKGNQNQNRMK